MYNDQPITASNPQKTQTEKGTTKMDSRDE